MEPIAVLEGEEAAEVVVDTVTEETRVGRVVVAAEAVVDTVREATRVGVTVVAAGAIMDTVRSASGVGVTVTAEDVVDPVEEDVGWDAVVAWEEVISTVVMNGVVRPEPRPGLLLVSIAAITRLSSPIVVAFTIGSRLKAET